MTSRWLAFAVLGNVACGASHGRVVRASAPPSGTEATNARASTGALESLRAQSAAGDRDALATLGVRLEQAGRAREITGDVATDERVSEARVLARDRDAAALLVVTSCGNATLAGVHWDGARWVAAERVALFADLRPGSCAQSSVRAESLALSSDARREIAVVLASQDATGEETRGPFLSVFQIGPDGALQALLRDAPFGSVDDATGATTVGTYAVVEDIPAPRPLHVSIRPGRRGPGGAPIGEVVERTYVLHDSQLVLLNEHTEAAE